MGHACIKAVVDALHETFKDIRGSYEARS